jgi:hypothetical protein
MPRRVGFGKAEITPPLPVSLAGFGTPQHATEVHDPLEARALFIDEDGVTVCLVVCDLLGMSAAFAGPARAAVADALGLPSAAVLIACTHTHSGPSAMEGTAALGWITPDGYGDVIAAGCRAAAVAASGAAAPANLSYRRAPLPPGLSLNRRGYPYDPYFSVVDISAADGGRIGSLSNLAIHPVALGPECLAVSADWVGPFRQAVEATAGGSSVMLSGALGDVNPSHVHRQNNDCRKDGFEEAADLGAGVAEAVETALKEVEPLDGALRIVAQRTIDVPIGGTPLAASRGSATMTVELLEWAVGPLRIVSVPGEAFHAFGRRVDDSRGNVTLLAGLAPEWMGYLPVPFEDGGYEEGVSYGPAAVEAILTSLLEVPA